MEGKWRIFKFPFFRLVILRRKRGVFPAIYRVSLKRKSGPSFFTKSVRFRSFELFFRPIESSRRDQKNGHGWGPGLFKGIGVNWVLVSPVSIIFGFSGFRFWTNLKQTKKSRQGYHSSFEFLGCERMQRSLNGGSPPWGIICILQATQEKFEIRVIALSGFFVFFLRLV